MTNYLLSLFLLMVFSKITTHATQELELDHLNVTFINCTATKSLGRQEESACKTDLVAFESLKVKPLAIDRW